MLKDDQTLVEMQPASFASEDDFQTLLARFPALLAGAQINEADPRRWLLVAREKAVTDAKDGAGRWSLDHLFLDQDGIPTLVEVKRQGDTRIRREVVGQMLDYAANSVAWWSVEEIRTAFEVTCSKGGTGPDETLAGLIGPDADAEVFWQRVRTNLQAGRIRMLFVADVIPPELRRIVEFLNRQMNPAEVLALELRQYEGQAMRTIVPMVHGLTGVVPGSKPVAVEKRAWDTASFYAELQQRRGADAVSAAQKIETWMRQNADEVWFGSGLKNGSVNFTVTGQGNRFVPMTIWTTGDVNTVLSYCRKPPFDEPALMQEWAHKLVAAVGSTARVTDTNVAIPLDTLVASPAAIDNLLQVMAWAFSYMRKGAAVTTGGSGG